MNDHYFCVQILLFVVIPLIASSTTRPLTHLWTCPQDSHFQHNLCHDPAHPDTTFATGCRVCSLPSNFKHNLRRATLEMSDYLQEEITNFETEYIRWQFNIQQLQHVNLAHILGMEIPYEFESYNSLTTTYMKMAKFLRLFHKLWCLYSSRAEQNCSLSFPDTFHRLKARLLGKWWIVQNSCGQQIGHHHCETSVPAFSNNILRCEDIRNIIYILLRDARSMLDTSLITVDQM